MIYGTAWKKERTSLLVTLALDCGFRAIDTANQPKHYNEPGVGEALKVFFSKGHHREDIFIQTKFTPFDGHDDRIPYNPKSSLVKQVGESFQGSLNNLSVEYVDSYLLHGPYGYPHLSEEDFEVWRALEKIYEYHGTKMIGISNVNLFQIKELYEKAKIKPMVVQNRCYANRGWDLEVREFCEKNDIEYQGFSLLTANPQILHHSSLLDIAERLEKTPAQVVFAFSRALGIMPLTGTTDLEHMKEDLAVKDISLNQEEISLISKLF